MGTTKRGFLATGLLLSFACSSVPEEPDGGVVADAGSGLSCRAAMEDCIYSDSCCEPARCVGGTCQECIELLEPCSILVPCCSGLDCIGQQCRPHCSSLGSACTESEPCCDKLACLNGACAPCRQPAESCTDSQECCNGVKCLGGECAKRCSPPGGRCKLPTDCCPSLGCNSNGRCA